MGLNPGTPLVAVTTTADGQLTSTSYSELLLNAVLHRTMQLVGVGK